MAEADLREVGTPFSISFSGSGFLAIYQIGVVQSLLELAPEILKSASKVYGASAGSLIAAAVVCESSLEDLRESFHEAAKDARKTIFGPLSPGCNMLRTVQKGLYKMLPENSHRMASGRLHISLTRVMDGQNVMVSQFTSKEDLIQALICSCFVPIYCGFIPPTFRGVRYVDGGFTNLQPCTDLEAVITVSPFTGELDICPRDCPAIFYCFQIFNSSIQISVENLCRISYALFPPSYLVLHEFYFRGYQDAVLFLHRNDAFGISYPANTVTFRFASLLSKNDLPRANEESSCRNSDTGGLESNRPAPGDHHERDPAVNVTINGTDREMRAQLPPCHHKDGQLIQPLVSGMCVAVGADVCWEYAVVVRGRQAAGLLDSVAEITSQCLMSYKLPAKMMFSLSQRYIRGAMDLLYTHNFRYFASAPAVLLTTSVAFKYPKQLLPAGSGFLINYQIGALRALWDLAPEIMRSVSKVYGSSCGSLVAAAMACDVDLGVVEEFVYEALEETRKARVLTLCPGYCTLRIIEKALRKALSENSYQLASGKLCISLTRLLDLQNVIVSEYQSNEELMQALICSCFIPFYCGFNPPSFRGVRYIDGGITNLQPGSDLETMITISPFSGEVDICPRDRSAYFSCIGIVKATTFQVSFENLIRLTYSIFPPSLLVLSDFYFEGYHDAIFFLQRHRENWTVEGMDKKIVQQTPLHCDKAPPALKSQETTGSLDSAAEITSQHLVPDKLPMNRSLSLTDR